MSAAPPVVVVGASAGGVSALARLASRLPEGFPGAVLVVLHVPMRGSALPSILARVARLPVAHAVDGEVLEAGRVYVAPPGRHLLVQDGHARLSAGPRENGHRPAVDPLFCSAADALGADVIGVVLTGTLDDGAVGLGRVRAAGGRAVVQDPAEADYPGMPQAALRAVPGAEVVRIDDLASVLQAMLQGPADGAPGGEGVMDPHEGGNDPQQGEVSGFTCPECHGALWRTGVGDVQSYRCRVGHAYSAASLDEEQARSLEAAMWAALRALREREALCRELGAAASGRGHANAARQFAQRAEQAGGQADLVERALGMAVDLGGEAA